MPDDVFDFVNSIALNIGERAENHGLESLSEPEKTVMLIWWAAGIIGNGGFQYFYEGATEGREVADAFDRLGLSTAADACRRSLTIFPDHVPPSDQAERCRVLEPYYQEGNPFLTHLSECIWDVAEDNLEQRLADYIKANREAFSDL